MEIWRFQEQADVGFALVDIVETDTLNLVDWGKNFIGKPLQATWTPPSLYFGEGIRTDFPGHVAGTVIASDRAVAALSSLIENDVEILPISIEGGGYWLLNITRVVDCLDYQHSQIRRSHFSDTISEIEKYVLHTEPLHGVHLFRMPEKRRTRLFCSGEVRQAILSAGLTGLEFRLEYSCEH